MKEELVYHVLDDKDQSVGWSRDVNFAHRFCRSMNLGLENPLYEVVVLGVDYGKVREKDSRE